MIKEKIKSSIKHGLLKLPPLFVFDYIYHLTFFWVAHKRLPRRNSGLLNDYLFFHKTSRDVSSSLCQFVSDKELVKIFYRGVLGVDLAPTTLLKITDARSLPSAVFPFPAVVKPTHLSGCVFFDGSDSEHLEKQIERWLDLNIYRHISRERNYANLEPAVIFEEVIASIHAVRDYKIFCHNGKPKAVQVDIDRHTNHTRRMYTVDWQALPFCYNKPLAEEEARPRGLDLALEYATKIARFFEFIRVDVYLVEGRVYLGELTSVPENAHGRFESIEAERQFAKIVFDD